MATKRIVISTEETEERVPKKKTSISPYSIEDLYGELEKVVKIQSVTLSNESRLSTGLLTLDLLLGHGGVTAGMYIFAGPEQSAKTTLAVSILAASVGQAVGSRILWDAENSSGSSLNYVENIFRGQGVKVSVGSIFGLKAQKGYAIKPLVYYRDEGNMSTFFDWTAALLRRLPDKRLVDDKWWFVYEATKENKSLYRDVLDRRMSSEHGAVYIPADDGALQSVILVDSLPSLLPDAMDDDDPKAGMALQAREFAKHLPRIKGKLRAKRVAIIAINQIREKIGFVMGDPRYEPGGNALRYFSDVRLWLNPRALSGVPFSPKGKGQIEKEPAIDGGEDTYRYIHVKGVKNKLGVPGMETWLRIWVSDSKMRARGFCPVWDTFYALSQTGQLTGKRTSIILNLSGMGTATKAISWMEFKTLILGDKESQSKIYARIGYKPINLRTGLASMSRKGKLHELLVANTLNPNKVSEEDEDENDDVDEV